MRQPSWSCDQAFVPIFLEIGVVLALEVVLVEKIFENVDEWTDRRLGVIGFALKYATCEFHVN